MSSLVLFVPQVNLVFTYMSVIHFLSLGTVFFINQVSPSLGDSFASLYFSRYVLQFNPFNLQIVFIFKFGRQDLARQFAKRNTLQKILMCQR